MSNQQLTLAPLKIGEQIVDNREGILVVAPGGLLRLTHSFGTGLTLTNGHSFSYTFNEGDVLFSGG